MDRIDGAGHVARRFVAEDSGLNRPPTEITEKWLNAIQEEPLGVIEDVGLVPSAADEKQLVKAIKMLFQRAAPISAAASGTVDAITANYLPAITALTDHMLVIVRAGGANTISGVTFTPNAALIAPAPVVKGHNQALSIGDFSGAGFRAELQYDLTLGKWVLLNPATGVSTPNTYKQLVSVAASVAANALTVTLNPQTLDFRSPTLTIGVPFARVITNPLSLVIPAGASLGAQNGQPSRFVILAIDNGGTIEPAVVNLAGGNSLDESALISTVAISAAAAAANVIYSATARANVPFRVCGIVDITAAVAGTWSTPPSTVQGQGGLALAALSSLGYGQTWQPVSRVNGTTYYNTTGRAILLKADGVGGANTWSVALSINGISMGYLCGAYAAGPASGCIVIPPGASYVMTDSGSPASRSNFELR